MATRKFRVVLEIAVPVVEGEITPDAAGISEGLREDLKGAWWAEMGGNTTVYHATEVKQVSKEEREEAISAFVEQTRMLIADGEARWQAEGLLETVEAMLRRGEITGLEADITAALAVKREAEAE